MSLNPSVPRVAEFKPIPLRRRKIRAVIIPIVAIPVSLVGAVFLMLVAGFTINLLTLLAIVLSVGLVGIAFQPATVTGGLPSALTITLSGPAPAGGAGVTLFNARIALTTSLEICTVKPASSRAFL